MALFEGYQLMIFEWVLFAVTVPFVAIRLYVQLYFRYRPWRELLTVTALLLYLGQTVVDQLIDNYGINDADYDPHEVTPRNVKIQKTVVFCMTAYTTSIYCAKFVLLLFYMDVTPKFAFPKTWWLIMFTWAESIAGCLYNIIYEFATCEKFSDHWDPSKSECWSKEWYFASSWAVHTLSELLVYGIPFIILRNLIKSGTISPSDKKAAIWMLVVGTFHVLCGIEMLLYNTLTSPGKSFNWELHWAIYAFVAALWQGMTIIIICLPQCRRLWLGLSAEKMKRQKRVVPAMVPPPQEKQSEGSGWGDGSTLEHRGSLLDQKSRDQSSFEKSPDVEAQVKSLQ